VVVPVTERLVANVAPAFVPMLSATMRKMSSYSEDEVRLVVEVISDITEILRAETRRVRMRTSAGETIDPADDDPAQEVV